MDLKALLFENKKNLIILVGLILIGMIVFVSLSSFSNVGGKVTEITFEETATSIVETKQYQIKYSVYPSTLKNAKIAWSSSNENVATVDSKGLVTAIKPGTAVIVATSTNGIYRSLTLTVTKQSISDQTVVFDIENFDLKVGTFRRLYPVFNPTSIVYESITWTSSNEKVATVSQIGKITALTTGKTTITATVKLDSSNYISTSTLINVVKATTLSLSNSSSKSIETDATSEVILAVSDSNVSIKQISAETSNDNIVQVIKRPSFDSENSKITSIIKGMGIGSATVTYTAETTDGEMVKYELKVTVK